MLNIKHNVQTSEDFRLKMIRINDFIDNILIKQTSEDFK